MLVDPGNNLWCEDGKGTLYAYEVCDAVEAKHFRLTVLLRATSSTQLFSKHSTNGNSVQFDHMKTVKRPFQILKDGYAPGRKAGKRKVTLRSSPKKASELRRENRDLHRSEFR